MALKKTAIFSVILAGASAVAVQIVFMREFLVVSYGNEISIGIVLAAWLIWGALGSWGLGRFSDRIGPRIRVFAMCQLVLAVVLLAAFLIVRSSKTMMGILPGEIIGYLPMILSAFMALCLPCTVMGFMFSLACRIYRDITGHSAESIAGIYVMEAVGALSGGLLATCLMFYHVSSFSVVLLFAFLNAFASLAMQRQGEPFRFKKPVFYVTMVLVLLALLAVTLGAGRQLARFSQERLWAGFDVLESKNSVYGNITVTGKGKQLSFYENGLHLYTVPDRLSAEEAVHFNLLETENPENVLLIGGGAGGLLKEILKHPVGRVDYVELDPMIIDMAKRHLSAEDSAFLSRPEVNIINEDGRFFVKRTRRAYDSVIINLGDPYTAQINRFYTTGFFRELSRILNKKAVVSFSLTSSANYISEELGDYLRSVYLSAREIFPEVLIVPGDTACFLAANTAGVLTHDSDILMSRMRKRNIDAGYVREGYIRDKLSDERVEYARGEIEEGPPVAVNRDFRPVSYYYATVFWGTQFDAPFFRRILRLITPKNIWLLAIVFCALILIFFVCAGKKNNRRAVKLAVATTGFSEINFQIASLLSFQIIYGYVFYKLGIMITSFMVGLALGGWTISRLTPRMKDSMRSFRWIQGAICLYPLILPPIFLWFAGATSAAAAWTGANLVFPLLPAVAGFIGGVQFPLAGKICLAGSETVSGKCSRLAVGRVAGMCYGLDLLGAAVGALLAAAFLVPILGVFQTCYLTAMINVTVMAVLAIGQRA